MGLDVYVKWPGMSEQDQKTQITGFRSVGKAGYLRQSWGSLGAWDEVFKTVFGISWSEMLFPGWDGGNDGEGPDLSDKKEREQLTKNRDLLLAFIRKPVLPPETLKKYFGDWSKAVDVIKNEAQDVVDFINFAFEKESAKILFC